VEDEQVAAERARWLEQLAAAAQHAIGRLREVDDPAHTALLDDLQRFHERIVAQLGR
jgi:hypothetical protein